MARANLTVTEGLRDAWTQANIPMSTTKALKVGIGGESLVLLGSSLEPQFDDVVREQIVADQAAFLLFCLKEGNALQEKSSSSPSSSSSSSKRWLLCCYVPSLCPVRTRMLFSSSRQDLKTILGLLFFESEYSATDIDELSWANVQSYINRISNDRTALSQEELYIDEEMARIHATQAVSEAKSSAMNVIPFTISSELIDKLRGLKAGKADADDRYNVIEVGIADEELKVMSVASVKAESLASFSYNTSDPRFLIVCLPIPSIGEVATYLVFSSPEGSPIRQKMIMSTAKATLIAEAMSLGVTFDRSFEIQTRAELEESIRSDLGTIGAGDNPSLLVGTSGSGSSAVSSKPQRPGRGSSRPVRKFNAEEASTPGF